MAISLHTVGITVKDLGKSLAFYRTLGLSIPEGQDNEHHDDYKSENRFSIGFISETTMLHINPNLKAQTDVNRISLQFACKTETEFDETYNKLVNARQQSLKEKWDAFC